VQGFITGAAFAQMPSPKEFTSRLHTYKAHMTTACDHWLKTFTRSAPTPPADTVQQAQDCGLRNSAQSSPSERVGLVGKKPALAGAVL
jgi:hypothetical protein